jgi:Domain of unknown function (DUF1841)
MYTPTRDEARQFFFDTWLKYRRGEPLAGLESIALQVLLAHPEYHALVDAPERHADRDFSVDAGEINPFLHLSLHLAVEEQLSIDQPPGLRAEFERLRTAKGEHAAKHEVLECLGEVVWQAQRDRAAPDAQAYLECLRRKS